MGRARALIFAGVLIALVAVPQQAGAQYPPAPVNPECHSLIGGVGTSGGRVELPYLGFFQVEGEAGCTEGNSLIVVDGQSHRHNLHPGFRSNPDGSFLSPRIQLSPHMTPGPHNIIPRFTVGNVEFFCPILVLATSDNTNGGNDNNGGGGGGGGRTLNNVANRGGGGGGGVLPRTGAGILMLILWALALIALGTALVFAARRRGVLRIQPLRVVSTRLRRRRHLPLALPPPDVPFIDTAGFVPVRTKRTEIGPVTEADVQHDPKSWDD